MLSISKGWQLAIDMPIDTNILSDALELRNGRTCDARIWGAQARAMCTVYPCKYVFFSLPYFCAGGNARAHGRLRGSEMEDALDERRGS